MPSTKVNLTELNEKAKVELKSALTNLNSAIQYSRRVKIPLDLSSASRYSVINNQLSNIKNNVNTSITTINSRVIEIKKIETINERMANRFDKPYRIADRIDAATPESKTELSSSIEEVNENVNNQERANANPLDLGMGPISYEAFLEETTRVNKAIESQTGTIVASDFQSVANSSTVIQNLEFVTNAAASEKWYTTAGDWISEKWQSITDWLSKKWKEFKASWTGQMSNVILPDWESSNEPVQLLTAQVETTTAEINVLKAKKASIESQLDALNVDGNYDPYNDEEEHTFSWLIEQGINAVYDGYTTDIEKKEELKKQLAEIESQIEAKSKELSELTSLKISLVNALSEKFYSQFSEKEDFEANSYFEGVTDIEFSKEYGKNEAYMTDDEKKLYAYLFRIEGQDAAEEYINYLQTTVNSRIGYERAVEFLDKWVIKDEEGKPILDENGNIQISDINGFSVACKGYVDGLENFVDGLGNAISGITGQMSNVVSADQYETMYIVSALNSFDTGVYEISSSIGNMTIPIVVSTAMELLLPGSGEITGSALMGISAAGNTWKDAYCGGSSYWQSALYGSLTGVSETTLQYFLGGIPGLSKVDDMVGVAGFIMNIGKEGLEEFTQEILGGVLDHVVLGKEYELNIKDALKAGAYGIITAGILNGGKVVINTGTQVVSLVIDASKINDSSYQAAIKEVIEYYADNASQKTSVLSEKAQEIIQGIKNKVDVKTSTNQENANSENTDGTESFSVTDSELVQKGLTNKSDKKTKEAKEFIEGLVEDCNNYGFISKNSANLLEELLSNEDLVVGIHRTGGFTTGDQIIESGLVLSGDISSGIASNNPLNLDKNISFVSGHDYINYILLLSQIKTGGAYKSYNGKGDVVVYAFPKDAIVDGKLKPEYSSEILNGNRVNSDFAVGYFTSDNGNLSEIQGLNSKYQTYSETISRIINSENVEINNVNTESEYVGSPNEGVPNVQVVNNQSVNSHANIEITQTIEEDLLKVLAFHDNKYSTGDGLARLNEFFDSNSRNYHNYDLFTSNNNARFILRQYSPEQIEIAFNNLKDPQNSTYRLSGSLSNSYNHAALYNFFENSSGIYYGSDQAAIENLCIYKLINGIRTGKYSYRQAMDIVNNAKAQNQVLPKFKKIGNLEYWQLKEKLILKGFNKDDASIILSSINDAGACSYASVCNEIFYFFKDNPQLFLNTFGYPMYKMEAGVPALNATELLLDLYLYANDTQNGGKLIIGNQLNPQFISKKIDVYERNILDAKEQAYMSTSRGKNITTIDGFLKSKNPSLNYGAEIFMDNMVKAVYNAETMQKIKDYLIQEINFGKVPSLGMYYNPKNNDTVIRLISFNESAYSSTSTATWKEGGGHSVLITGVANNGLIVSSWGQKYVVPFEDLRNGARFVITMSTIEGR